MTLDEECIYIIWSLHDKLIAREKIKLIEKH